jgi:hypothetical protein
MADDNKSEKGGNVLSFSDVLAAVATDNNSKFTNYLK